MIENPKAQKDGERKVSLLSSFLEVTGALSLVCFPEIVYLYSRKKIILYGYTSIYFVHCNTNGRIECPLSAPCFFTMYLGESYLFIHIEFLCSFIGLHSGLFKERVRIYLTSPPLMDGRLFPFFRSLSL